MSIQDQKTFLSNIHPFEVLTPIEMEMCIKHMDIAYYPKNSIFLLSLKVQFMNIQAITLSLWIIKIKIHLIQTH